MPTYEAWHDPDQNAYPCGTAEQMADNRRRGSIGPRALLLYAFEAATHEEAQAIHSLRMGWGPYRPLGGTETMPGVRCILLPGR
jgi:hypothetical protein